MRIASVDTILIRIPFTDGGRGEGIMPDRWSDLDILLVRIESDNGLVGWGEGFGYYCTEATAAIVRRSLRPLLVGCELTSPSDIGDDIQRKMVLQGRYGISTFALSGVDIALWDLAAKVEGVNVATLLGNASRTSVPAYASLVRYADADCVARYCERAAGEGYGAVKLHEIDMQHIRPCRQVVGDAMDMVVDVNCNWTEEYTREVIPELKSLNTRWLEEPIFPPEDFATLASIRTLGMPLAAGENACTAFQIGEMLRRGAVDYAQPSITKVGGISEFIKVRDMAADRSVTLMPHSPYFGPGYLATLQMMAREDGGELFEYLYVEPEAWIYENMPLPKDGDVDIPSGPGLGMEPDMGVVERYVVGE